MRFAGPLPTPEVHARSLHGLHLKELVLILALLLGVVFLQRTYGVSHALHFLVWLLHVAVGSQVRTRVPTMA